jgi:hypothetical protein
LKRAQSEAYTRVATERHRVNWLKERGREHLPFFPQDEGFVDSLILAHAELIDESVPLDRWASQGLIATYGRFCSTWKERISEVQKMLQKLDVSTRELADGWEVTEAIYAGMLVYAKVPAAEAAVSQLIKMMEVDPKLVDIAQEFPRLSKIAMPGRFLIARGMVSCARGTSSALVANLILCNDILVAHFVGVDIYVHTLELCVVIQDEKAFTIEVLDSSVHIPMKMDLKSKEAFMKWNKWLNFGTMMAKSSKVRTLGGRSSSKWNMSREPDTK